jgi:SAM-dependent methyltransferase
MLKQTEQDNLWKHYQNQSTGVFDLSDSRLRFLAELCPAGTRVLNIGVGSGQLEKLLTARGVIVSSLDPVDESIEKLQAELGMGVRAKQGYSTNIPFEEGYFDKVIMTEVLEHIPPEDIPATLDEVMRVLKSGAEFTGTVPYRENLQFNNVFCPHCQSHFHRWGHFSSFDVASLGVLLRQHHFIVKQLYPRSFPDFRRPGVKLFIKSIIRHVLGRMGETLVGPNLYFISYKK